MKKNEILEMLIDKYGFSNDDLKEKSLDELKSLLGTAAETSEALDNTIEIKEVDEISTIKDIAEVNPQEESIPDMFDPEWTNYVMSLFTKDELVKGMPRVDGLRRVAGKLLGPFSILSNVVQIPNKDNDFSATVVINLEFQNGLQYSGSANVDVKNTPKPFNIHQVASAETKAEGRALKKALGLVRVLAAEELNSGDMVNENDTKKIDKSMLNGLTVMCNRLGIDLYKTAIYMGHDIGSPNDLTVQAGLDISDKINKFSSKKEEIPEGIRK